MPENTWLVAYDDTPHSKLALDEACRALAGREGAAIELFNALPFLADDDASPLAVGMGTSKFSPGQLAIGKATLKAIEEVAKNTRAEGVTMHASAMYGEITDAIRQAADRVDAELIVVGTHGHTGLARVFLGSVAERVVRDANRPVLVVRPGARNRAAFPPKTVGVTLTLDQDDAPGDVAAMDRALKTATRYQSKVRLLHVVDPAYVPAIGFQLSQEIRNEMQVAREDLSKTVHDRLDAYLARAKDAGLDAHAEVVSSSSSIADGIAHATELAEIDLLVTCAHRKTGLDRFIGSVATRILRASPAPVLVVRAGQN